VFLGSAGKIVVYRASDHAVADTLDLAAGSFTEVFGEAKQVVPPAVPGGGAPGNFAPAARVLRIDPIVIDGNNAVIHLHLRTLHYGERYLVIIDPLVFLDAQGQPFPGVTGNDDWTLTVRPARSQSLARRVVAADGTGDFCTVQGAVDDIPIPNTQPAVVFIEAGTYDGLVRVDKNQDHVSFVGEDRKKTILTGLNNERWNTSVSARAVVGVEGDDFVMQNLTVRNRTPYKGSQAETVWINADRCVLRDDDFYSHQDTLCLNGRVYVTDCYIEGDVDFIWGYGSVFLNRCDVHAVHDGYFVQARNPVGKPGYIFFQCKLTCADEVKSCVLGRVAPETYPASQVAYLHCSMGPGIPPEGWQYDAPKGVIETKVVAGPQLQFEEYQSIDLQDRPVDVSHRLAGSKQLSDAEAAALSEPAKVLGGTDQWNPVAEGDAKP